MSAMGELLVVAGEVSGDIHAGNLVAALDRLGLDETADAAAIKARYKELVKRLHPDANGGSRATEETLRAVIDAYQMLRKAGLV